MVRRADNDTGKVAVPDVTVQSADRAAAAGRHDPVPSQGDALRLLARKVWRAVRPLLAVMILWEIIGRILGASALLLPPLLDIGEAMLDGFASGILFQHIGVTLFRLFAGFLLGGTLGIIFGLISGRVKVIADWTVPLCALFLPIPSLAFVPLYILWFGLGNLPVIILVAVASSMPVFMNSYTGTLTVEPVQVHAAQSMGATGRALFWKVVLPASLPYVIAGVRVGFARGWRAVIAGEFVAATGFGLGWFIFTSRAFLQTANVLVGIILIGVVGLIVEKVLWETIERRTVVKWGMVEEAVR